MVVVVVATTSLAAAANGRLTTDGTRRQRFVSSSYAGRRQHHWSARGSDLAVEGGGGRCPRDVNTPPAPITSIIIYATYYYYTYGGCVLLRRTCGGGLDERNGILSISPDDFYRTFRSCAVGSTVRGFRSIVDPMGKTTEHNNADEKSSSREQYIIMYFWSYTLLLPYSKSPHFGLILVE